MTALSLLFSHRKTNRTVLFNYRFSLFPLPSFCLIFFPHPVHCLPHFLSMEILMTKKRYLKPDVLNDLSTIIGSQQDTVTLNHHHHPIIRIFSPSSRSENKGPSSTSSRTIYKKKTMNILSVYHLRF